MSINIHNAVLHIIDNTTGKIYLSGQELDYESEACYDFICKHIKKLLNGAAVKNATFSPDSEFYADICSFKNRGLYFMPLSVKITEKMAEVIINNPDIAPADILIVSFSTNEIPYIGVFKLNYNECYTHKIDISGTEIDNQIIKYHSVLPATGGNKVEEACLIPLNVMVVKLVEKKHLVSGEMGFYFSNYVLDCNTELSKQESVKVIESVNKKINSKFFNQHVDNLAQVNNAIIEEAEEGEGIVRMENVAHRAFAEAPGVKEEYIKLIREGGIKEDLDLGEEFTRKHFGVQKFKADNGIEIKFPAEITEDGSVLFKHNADGTVTITLMNLRGKI
ncbi:MAG: nucleoid-associated protein [Clostridiales bacterium]|jgi:hypothetical protein|nr:nucleoid-associated protein [Clostridiales bacterium]